jgi:putative tricarboxylic transport membrane protein
VTFFCGSLPTPVGNPIFDAKGWLDGYLGREDFGRFVIAEEERSARTLARLGIGKTGGGNSPVGPWAFPVAIAVTATAAAAGVAYEQLRAPAGQEVAPAGAEDDDEGGGALPVWSRFLGGAVLVPTFIAALHFFGFLWATPFLVMAVCLMMQSKTLKWDALGAIALTGGTWFLFTKLLHVALP